MMQDYIDIFKENLNRLAGLGNPVSECLQVTMLLASFGHKNASPFDHVTASSQYIQEGFDQETKTARLLQDYEEQRIHSGSTRSKRNDPGQALTASEEQRRRAERYYRKPDRRRCFDCQQVGHIARNCPRRKNMNTRSEKVLSTDDSLGLYGQTSKA